MDAKADAKATPIAPWSSAPLSELRSIRGVCLDIDDTLSSHGKLTASAFQSLWNLQKAGFQVIPITGRPAGWCDLIARFWPVHAVVGENGAFSFFMQDGKRHRLDTESGPDLSARRGQIEKLGQTIRARFPQAKWASDQSYREYDLAIDTCEDVPPWKASDVDALLKLCASEGAHAKLSSIHVNAWFGNYDKNSGFLKLLKSGPLGLEPDLSRWIYIGDSPNDEPAFSIFKNSVGVANLRPYLPRLSHHPKWITAGESGEGFSEMAARLIESRDG